MAPPLLKLVFVKGPRDGDSIEYKPGSTIRIGRVVRGNEIAIKDAGISTKHLRIVSDSENWIVHDLGSSNGTILNSNTLDRDTPVNLRHGDIIKLGEFTSIVVNFVTGDEVPAPEEESKLPPRPRRNNRRLAAATETVPDPDPVESKPTRRGRPRKQDKAESKEDEPPPKGTRAATRSRTLEDTADTEKELEVEVNSRVRRSGRIAAITNVVVQEEDKKGKSRVRRGKNIESVQNPTKLEIEDIPDDVEMNKASTSEQIGKPSLGLVNVKSEDIFLEQQDDNITSRATRRKKNENAGDSLLNQAPKSHARKKIMESGIDDVEEEKEEEEALKIIEEERDSKSQEKVDEQVERKLDLTKMTLGEWFDYMEIQLRKQIIEETEKEIEPLRSKALRVHKYIEEQKQAKEGAK